jgi:hypothetical protein
MSASYPVKMILAFRSGDLCALPGCDRKLTVEGKNGATASTGEAAHIAGERPDAARYDVTMTDDERDAVPNLIYLCGDCHTKIDKLWQDWSVDKLVTIKANHEAKVSRAVEDAFAEVNFPELEKAMSWLSSVEPTKDTVDFFLLTPEAKISKNNLSNGTRHIITSGLSSRQVVSDYVESETKLDPDCPERLKSGFLAEYHRLRSQGHRDNALFELMCVFSQRGAVDQAAKTAGLAVLVYLFEICDVFEK